MTEGATIVSGQLGREIICTTFGLCDFIVPVCIHSGPVPKNLLTIFYLDINHQHSTRYENRFKQNLTD